MQTDKNTDTEAEQILAKLVAMPTVSDDATINQAALDYIESYLAERGMFCRRHTFDGHGTLVAATRRDNSKTATVALAAHVDVMEGSEQVFRLRTEGDKLIGRGVYDMKFAIAGYMQWVNDHQQNLADYDVAIIITTDEEYGGRDDINGTERLMEQGYKPKVAVLPDSTAPHWDIETLAKGYWRFDIVANGKTAHGSRPWDGDSAAFKLIPALHELQEHFKDHGPATDTLNIGILEGGTAFNQIPDSMRASVELRLASEHSFAQLSSVVEEITNRHGLEVRSRVIGQPVVTDTALPLVAAFIDSVTSVTGRRPKPYMSFAASDAPYFTAAGVPCIISCPDGGGHHSEAEWISRSDFLQWVPILNHYLDAVAKKS